MLSPPPARSTSRLARVNPEHPEPAVVARAAAIIRAGGLVAFPTETVYGLGAHALDPAAVARIFAAKHRPGWDPLIVHVRDVAAARSLMRGVPARFEELAARFWPGPLTLIVPKADVVPAVVTAGRETVALRLPHHPVASALLAGADCPIAAPSANRFGSPSPTRAGHVAHDLGDAVDLILDAGPTTVGIESTILDLTVDPPAIRRPGGVSRESLTTLLGPVSIGPGVTDSEAARTGLPAPGMTLKHYAPRATIELFEAQTPELAQLLLARGDELERREQRVGLLDPGPDLDAFAHCLFDELRRLDDEGCHVILAVLPPPVGIGLAIRDRLQRAAGRPPSL